MKKVIVKIWDVIKTILVVAMIGVTASLLVMKIMGDTPSIMGYNLYYIATPSMEPTLEVGDIILSKEVTDYSKLKEHDVITYQGEVGSYAGKLITHEIIEVIEHEDGSITFLTKGTNPSASVDPEIRADQVRTKMVCEIPFLAAAFGFSAVSFGEYAIAIGLGACVIPVVELVKFIQRKLGK